MLRVGVLNSDEWDDEALPPYDAKSDIHEIIAELVAPTGIAYGRQDEYEQHEQNGEQDDLKHDHAHRPFLRRLDQSHESEGYHAAKEDDHKPDGAAHSPYGFDLRIQLVCGKLSHRLPNLVG